MKTELEKEFLESCHEKIGGDCSRDFYYSEDFDDWRQEWLKRPEDLDKLVKSDNSEVRYYMVDVGRDKDLDKLVNDKYEAVRVEVAWRGRDKDLLTLIGDSDKLVQAVVQNRIKLKFEELEDLQQRLEEK